MVNLKKECAAAALSVVVVVCLFVLLFWKQRRKKDEERFLLMWVGMHANCLEWILFVCSLVILLVEWVKKKKGKVAQVFREYFFIELKGQANLSEIEALSNGRRNYGEDLTTVWHRHTRSIQTRAALSLRLQSNPNHPTYFGRPLRMDEAETRARRFP